MTTISLRALSPAPTTTQLIDTATGAGLRVCWTCPDHPTQAAYAHTAQTIWLRHDLTEAEARSLLAHELGHHHYGDHGPQPAPVEDRAWRYAAKLLIPKCRYAIAELEHGPSVPGLAEALHVTVEVVTAYQSILRRAA